MTKIYAQEKKKSEDREKKEVIDEVMKFINKMYLGHLYEDAKCFLFSLALYIACKQALLVLGEGDSSPSSPPPPKKKTDIACMLLYILTASILINLCAVFNPSSPVFQHQNQYSPIFSVILRGEFGSLVTDLS